MCAKHANITFPIVNDMISPRKSRLASREIQRAIYPAMLQISSKAVSAPLSCAAAAMTISRSRRSAAGTRSSISSTAGAAVSSTTIGYENFVLAQLDASDFALLIA
jgi:hypothetical protein